MPTTITKRSRQTSDIPLLVAFLILGLLISAIFWYGGRLHSQTTEATPQQLFTQYCAACHGFSGEGNTALGAPALNSDGSLYEHSDGEIQRAIMTGGEIMPKHEQILTSTQAADIVQYIKTWWTDEQIASQQTLSEQDPLQP